MILSKFVEYIKQAWVNRPSTTTPLSSERMLHLEAGIKANNEAIEELAAAVLSNIVNDPNKIASMAVAYSLQQQITQLNSDCKTKTGTIYFSRTKASNDNTCVEFSNIPVIYRRPCLFIGNANGNPIMGSIAYCSNNKAECSISIEGYNVSIEANEDGTINLIVDGVSAWGHYTIVVF